MEYQYSSQYDTIFEKYFNKFLYCTPRNLQIIIQHNPLKTSE